MKSTPFAPSVVVDVDGSSNQIGERTLHGLDRGGILHAILASKGIQAWIGHPDAAAIILPNRYAQRQVQRDRLAALHELGADRGVAEHDDLGRAELQARLARVAV